MHINTLKLFVAALFFGISTLASATASQPIANANAEPETIPATPANVGQRVTFESADNTVIVGSFFASAKANSPALLLLHQWQSDRHAYDDFANRMHVAEGFNVLSIDGRGFGESTKTADGKSVSAGRTDADVKAMLGDVGAAFDYLSKQKNVDPAKIGIVGASYGSSLALIYAANNPMVAAVALLSPGLNYFGNMPTESAIKKYGDRPLFLVAAEDDKESVDAVRTLFAEANNPRYGQKVYATGGHGTGLLRANVGLDLALKSFLTEKLIPNHN